jgi:hypothetical protein
MKKLTAILGLAAALSLAGCSQYNPLQNNLINEKDERRIFLASEYEENEIDSRLDLKKGFVYRLYDLDKNGISDSGASFKIVGSYLSEIGEIEYITNERAQVLMLESKDEKRTVIYFDFDENGTLETKIDGDLKEVNLKKVIQENA